MAGTKSGFVFPVVLVSLAIFAIVGMTMMFSGTSEYQQTAVVTHGLVANQLAQGVLEEMRAIVYDRVNDVDPAKAVWRQEVIDAAKSSGSGTGKLEKDLKAELPESQSMIDAMKGPSGAGAELLEAKVTFHNFHAIRYATKDTYEVDDVYYHFPGLDAKKPEAPNKRDYIGYYNAQVAVRFGKAKKYFAVTHDVKIIDVSPPAREFCVFAFNVFKQEHEGYLKECLNKGGAMHFYSGDAGRMFIRGPYFLDISDHPKGVGGHKPEKGMGAAPPDPSFCNTNEWWNWTMLPAPHEGLMGGSFNNRSPARPDDTSGTSASFNAFGFDLFNGDPGINMPTGQQWFVGNVAWGKTNFSIWGAPDKGRDYIKFPRCLKNKYNDQGQKTGSEPYEGGLGGLSGGDESSVITCEGDGLIGNYNVAAFKSWEVKIPPVVGAKIKHYSVDVDRSKTVNVPYGFRWEKEREGASGWLSLAIDIISLATIWMGGFGSVATVLMSVGKATLQGFAAGAMAGMLFPATALPPVGVSAADLMRISEYGYWPTNFKPYTRCAVRAYKTLPEAMTAPDQPLLLDGVVMVDNLQMDQTLNYRGKGILSCFTSGTENFDAKLAGGIKRASDDSHATVVFMNSADPLSTEAMLTLGNVGSTDGNDASFMVAGAIMPTGANTVINGNLVCLALNKKHIPDSASLDVFYDTARLTSAEKGGTYDAKAWIIPAVSPKISGFTDRFTVTSTGAITGEGATDLGGFTGF
ncbi:MAG: hypothetical protein HY814_11740 [Candidatus Riflebacteria bacterium]|nr:hypothetical protein [Candidatus Riflebacteria bacterium]